EPNSRAHRLLARLGATLPWVLGGGIVGALLGFCMLALEWWLGGGPAMQAWRQLREPKSFWELAGEVAFSGRTILWMVACLATGLVTLIALWRTPKWRVGVLLALACPAVATGYIFLLTFRLAWAQERWISGPVSEVLITALVGASCGPLVKAYVEAKAF